MLTCRRWLLLHQGQYVGVWLYKIAGCHMVGGNVAKMQSCGLVDAVRLLMQIDVTFHFPPGDISLSSFPPLHDVVFRNRRRRAGAETSKWRVGVMTKAQTNPTIRCETAKAESARMMLLVDPACVIPGIKHHRRRIQLPYPTSL